MGIEFEPGELFVYTNGNRWELGMVKRPNGRGDGYFCWYSRGDTASNTPVAHMHKLENAGFTHIEQLLDAATVGAGTCHAVLDKGYYKGINGVCEGLYCSKCKEPLSRRFKHCPWCGGKIKED